MMCAPLPPDEGQRLAALRALNILDSAPEAEFDSLAKAASVVCDTPISLISLIDADRQWFKANVGLPDVRQTSRDIAFCAHAIGSDALLEVPDALADPRFADNPLVTGQPEIRFYAGSPLRLSNGNRVGTLCVIDRQAGHLADRQRAALGHLADAVAHAMERRNSAAGQAADRAPAAGNESADKARSDFLSRVSHEMRTPLNAIIGFAQLLKLPAHASRTEQYADQIHGAGLHLLAMVEDLLDLQLGARQALRLQSVQLDVLQIVNAVRPLLQAQADERQITLSIEVPVGLRATADPTRLRQVMLNIGSNAIKYNRPAGHVSIRGATADGERVALVFEDDGIGMTAEQQTRLFHAFDRLGRELTNTPGTGLGLVIARDLMLAMDGTLDVASRARQGTRVTLTLPGPGQSAAGDPHHGVGPGPIA